MFIGGIIAPIFVVFITIKFLNDKADLRVYVSPIISTEFVSSETRNYQQSFTIRNEGNKSAKNIQFSVEGNVVKTKVEKHLAVDGVTEKFQNGDFSLSYLSLNPGSEFTVFILFNEEVATLPKVSFDEGVATYGAKVNRLDTIIAFSFPVLYIFLLISFFRWLYLSSLYFNVGTNFLIKSKPILLTNKEFNNLAEYVIKIVCVPSFRGYKQSIFEFNSIKTISSLNGKKNHFSDEICNKLEEALNNQFIEEMKFALRECSNLNEFESFYILDKPNIITHDTWINFKKELNDQFIEKTRYVLSESTNLSELENLYQLAQPNKITDETWTKFKKELHTQVKKVVPNNDSFREINKQILATLDKGAVKGMSRDEYVEHEKILIQSLPIILVTRLMVSPILIRTIGLNEYERELDYLPDYDRTRVERLFYIFNLLQEKVFDLIWSYKEDTLQTLLKNKPAWVLDKEWTYIEDVIKKLLKSIKVESKALELIATIREIPEIHVNTKYDHELLNVESLNSYLEGIRTIEVKQNDKDKDLQQREVKVSASELEWNLKVDKLQKQLDLIDRILNRALDVGKIEYPETLFNKESWNNLIKVESILKNID